MNKKEFISKVENLIKNHEHKTLWDIYGDKNGEINGEINELGVIRVRAEYIREESFDNLKLGTLIYFFDNPKILNNILDIKKDEIYLEKIKGKNEFWAVGCGNNRPFFVKHFPELIHRDWIWADVNEIDLN